MFSEIFDNIFPWETDASYQSKDLKEALRGKETAIVLRTGSKSKAVWMGYKLRISIFLWMHMCVGKLEFGLSNSDLEKVSLIACIGQFFSAMEIQSEPIKKKQKNNLLVSKSKWTFPIIF